MCDSLRTCKITNESVISSLNNKEKNEEEKITKYDSKTELIQIKCFEGNGWMKDHSLVTIYEFTNEELVN